MKISDYAIKHPPVITILLIALVLGSAVAVSGIKRQLFARIDLPQALIFTTWPGGSPEDIEREITNPLEDELSQISNVSSLTSTSSDSVSFITIAFTMETRVEDKLVEIREKLNNAASQLPSDISGPPSVFKMSSSSLSAYQAAVRSSLPLGTLSSFMEDQIIPRFSRISGVGQATLLGSIKEEIFIELNLDRLMDLNLSPLEVLQIVQSGNISLPAGSVTLEKRTLNIKTRGRFNSLREIEELVVGYRGNSQIRLRDVAQISLIPKKRDVIPISRGEEIIMVDFDLVQEADTTETIALIKREMRLIEKEQGNLIHFFTLNDDSRTIELSLSSVINSAVAGGILAVLILFLFLHNFRTTTIVSLSIPLSLMLALAAMKLSGMTLNIMTLGGLTIAIGMIVDSSIVILENIYRHYRFTEDKVEAARLGAEEMGGAVTASTMTSLAVFLPLLFLKGMVGEILRDISLTMGYSLLASLLAALVVVPYLSARWLKPHPKKGEAPPKLERIFFFMERFMAWLSSGYGSLIKKALNHRLPVIGLSLFLLGASLLLTRFLGFEFVPSTDMNEIILSCEFPPSYSLEQTREKTILLEEVIYELMPELESSAFTVGGGTMLMGGRSSNLSRGNLQLIRTVDRKRSTHELVNYLQDELPRRIPDLNLTVKNGGFDELLDFSTGGIGMVIHLYGSDLEKLIQASERVLAVMEKDPNVKKADRSVRVNEQELVIDLDHALMGNLGITAREASLTSRIVFNGLDGGNWENEGKNLPIRVGSSYDTENLDRQFLNRLFVKNLAGTNVPMVAFSTLRKEKALSAINHKDRMTTIKVTGELYESNMRDTRDRVTGILEKTAFPAGVEWEVGGSSAEMASSFKSMFIIMGAAIFLVYMVMVIQFERFAQPLIVMASVPFTLIGVVLGLLLFGSTLNVVSLLGMIALSGIVVNNAIVLIDYTNLLRSRGMDLMEAVIEGGTSRLKPIVMTSLTTILGLLPIALGLGEGGKLLSSLGQAIAGGLITSTLITLVLIPVLYSLLEERIQKKADKKGENR